MSEHNYTSEELVEMMNNIDERNERIDKIRRRIKMRNDIYEQFKQGSGKGTKESSSD